MRTGRPRALTPAVAEKICEGLKLGLSRNDAAIYGGISRTTLFKEQAENPDFADQLKSAEIQGKAVQVGRVATGSKQWQSGAWWLERKFPREWGRRDPNVLTPAQLSTIIDRIAMRLKATIPQEHHGKLADAITDILRDLSSLDLRDPKDATDSNGEPLAGNAAELHAAKVERSTLTIKPDDE